MVWLSFCEICIGALFCCWKGSDKSADGKQLDQFSSASEMVNAIRQGRITSVELLNLHINHIERCNDVLNAVVVLDVEAARQRAALEDKAIAKGESWSPLQGLPMTVKDVFEVVGMPATSGAPKLKNYIPNRNAIAVQSLIDAGAIIFDKTTDPHCDPAILRYESGHTLIEMVDSFSASGHDSWGRQNIFHFQNERTKK